MSHVIQARAARGDPARAIATDADLVGRFLEDAAHVPGGHAAGVVMPVSEAGVAAVLQSAAHVLPVGAQSSLTGGATPRGEMILSTARFTDIHAISAGTVRAGSGVTLDSLEDALASLGRIFPPTPTFTGATIGGIVATNAAGAATFKYGSTRRWVQALTVVLPDGDVLDIERGQTRAHPDGYFEFELRDRRVRVPVPGYHLPAVPKVSAGYFAAPEMDLIDLFVGSEGTLGIVTGVSLEVLTTRPAVCRAFVPFRDASAAFETAARLRAAAAAAWHSGGRQGVDVAAIEHLDARSLSLIREDGVDRTCGIRVPPDARMGLLVAIELPSGTGAQEVFDQLGRAGDADAPDTPLVRFCAALGAASGPDDVEVAVPGDTSRHAQFAALREAVPAAVNARVGRAQQLNDSRIEKTAGDFLVPFDEVAAFTMTCEAEMGRRGLDFAIWGHLSDGNLHPNVIPRTFADVDAGRVALLALGREAIRLGGVPLAEHGVGRSAIKQRLLLELYGEEGVDAMRRVKRAIDPGWKLAPGVIFPR